jgi:hypothetical protein
MSECPWQAVAIFLPKRDSVLSRISQLLSMWLGLLEFSIHKKYISPFLKCFSQSSHQNFFKYLDVFPPIPWKTCGRIMVGLYINLQIFKNRKENMEMKKNATIFFSLIFQFLNLFPIK